MSADKIQRMANQIAIFMETKPPELGLTEFANHINDFWEPRMRRQLFALLDGGAEGLRPLVLRAAPLIRRPAEGPTEGPTQDPAEAQARVTPLAGGHGATGRDR